MPSIRNSAFRGEVPRLEPHLLESSRSQLAVNCNLLSSGLRAWRSPLSLSQLVQPNLPKTLYLYGAEDVPANQFWCEFDSDVDIVRSPIAGDATEITAFTDGTKPRVFDNTMVDVGAGSTYPKSSYYLGIPAPTTASAATLGSGGSGSSRLLSYVYTFVRKWSGGKDDEGPPSPPSTSVDALPGQHVTVDTFDSAPTNCGITHIRIYRVATGTTGAEYQYVDEITIATSSYDDSLLDTELGEVLPSEDWLPPPDDLQGMIILPNGSAAGFSGNQVCYSEMGQLHAWPIAYRQACMHPIVGIGAVGTTVVAATTGVPYTFYGTDPSSLSPKMAQSAQGCVSKRGIVSTPIGVLYPGHDGMVLIDTSGVPRLYTKNLMTEREWADFNPDTLLGVWFDGRYVGFYEEGTVGGDPFGDGFILDPAETGVELTRLGLFAHAAYVDRVSDILYFAKTNSFGTFITQWEGGGSKLSYTWRSKRFLTERLTNFAAARIDADYGDVPTAEEVAAYEAELAAVAAGNAALMAAGSIGGEINSDSINTFTINGDILTRIIDELSAVIGFNFKLFSDGIEVFSEYIDSPEPFRLPDGYMGRAFEFEISGTADVRSVAIASSIFDLAEG